jgi:hypothetical protein
LRPSERQRKMLRRLRQRWKSYACAEIPLEIEVIKIPTESPTYFKTAKCRTESVIYRITTRLK